MPNIRQIHVKLAIAAAAMLLGSITQPYPAEGSAYQQCETCWNEYFTLNWHHNFPENDGNWDCDTGDGCHGTYYELDTCDEAGHQYPCVVNESDMEALFALYQGDGDLGIARDVFAKNGSSISLDADNDLLLVASCAGSIVASIPLTQQQIAALND